MRSASKLTAAAACCIMGGACASAQTTLAYAIPFTEGDATSAHARAWAEDVAERTGGSVVIEPVYNGALVSLPATLDGVADSVVPMGISAASYLSGAAPAFGYTELIGGMPTSDPATEDALVEVWPLIEEAL